MMALYLGCQNDKNGVVKRYALALLKIILDGNENEL